MVDNQKVYLQDALVNLPVWKSLDMWDGLLFVSIEEEIDKSNNQSKDQLFKDKNVIFNNILTLTLNMMNFKYLINLVKVTKAWHKIVGSEER